MAVLNEFRSVNSHFGTSLDIVCSGELLRKALLLDSSEEKKLHEKSGKEDFFGKKQGKRPESPAESQED